MQNLPPSGNLSKIRNLRFRTCSNIKSSHFKKEMRAPYTILQTYYVTAAHCCFDLATSFNSKIHAVILGIFLVKFIILARKDCI